VLGCACPGLKSTHARTYITKLKPKIYVTVYDKSPEEGRQLRQTEMDNQLRMFPVAMKRGIYISRIEATEHKSSVNSVGTYCMWDER
jgi:hypothetical protein